MPNFYGNESQNYAGRIPVVPLPYAEKTSAIKRELMVDYNDGNIYVVKDDGTIVDITKNMATLIQNINSSNTTVEIEGLGTILLKDLLQLLYDSNLDIEFTEEVATYLPTNKQFDFQSIQLKDNYIQLFNFDRADTNTVPVKVGEYIVWKKLAENSSGEMEQLPTQGDNATIEYHDDKLQIKDFDIADNGTILLKDDNRVYWVSKQVLAAMLTDGAIGLTEQEREDINNGISTNAANIGLLQTRVQQTENDIGSNTNSINTIVDAISSNVAETQAVAANVSTLGNSLAATSNSLSNNIAVTESHTTAINELETNVDTNTESIEALNTSTTEHEANTDIHSGFVFVSDPEHTAERTTGVTYGNVDEINNALFTMENNEGAPKYPRANIKNITDGNDNMIAYNGIAYTAVVSKASNIISITAPSDAVKIRFTPAFDYTPSMLFKLNDTDIDLVGIGGRVVTYGWSAGENVEMYHYNDKLILANDRIPDLDDTTVDNITFVLDNAKPGDMLRVNPNGTISTFTPEVLHIYEAGQKRNLELQYINNSDDATTIGNAADTVLSLSVHANGEENMSAVVYTIRDINLTGYSSLLLKYKNGATSAPDSGSISVYDKSGNLAQTYNLLYSAGQVTFNIELVNEGMGLSDIEIRLGGSGSDAPELNIFDIRAV